VSVLNPLHVQFFKYLSMIQLDYRIYRINWIGYIMYLFIRKKDRILANWKKLEKKLWIMSSFGSTELYKELYIHYKIVDSVKLKKNIFS
jgi:hypothetical protein